jgi:hypothetical protein
MDYAVKANALEFIILFGKRKTTIDVVHSYLDETNDI